MRMANKFIAVDVIEEEIKSDTGFILSGEDANNLRYKKAKVLSISPLVTPELGIKEGDVIYYDKHQGLTIHENGVVLTIIQERDVIGISV